MNFDEIKTMYGNETANTLNSLTPKNKFEKLILAIKKDDVMNMANIINLFPRSSIRDVIWKLGRYKYKRYPATKVAIEKLKWRAGF